ncbi:Mini-ribonuclease 3 [Mordavella massiliensis]|uniref:Mini-ribonuclease 3 n=1 Tax=Mordavella massiliensis TaxID=1871024 RepID=A0A938X9U6_9CLOT|nr:ribonuclease III domain-containing protein [Mordavella massiliensis]MBM6947556.1 ribonuclease III [Mordavella massiliensis]
MEKSIEEKDSGARFEECMERVLGLRQADAREYSPLTLAYIGDSIYDLVIKTLVINQGNRPVNALHRMTSSLVQASAQSRMMRTLQEMLTEEEHAVYKRGRNAKSVSPARNQSVTDYRRATGFEALMGYLYLERQWERMLFLIKTGLASLEEGAPEKEEEEE